VAKAAGMRMLAVVACAQNVVDRPKAAVPANPASAPNGPPSNRALARLTSARVPAASSALSQLMAVAGERPGARLTSQLSRVYSAKPGGCATPSSAPVN
jgi:hypothetical protein